MFFVRVKGTLYGSYTNLEDAKKAAGGHLLSHSGCRVAEVVPFVAGVIGGHGKPVATVKKGRTGKLTWTTSA